MTKFVTGENCFSEGFPPDDPVMFGGPYLCGPLKTAGQLGAAFKNLMGDMNSKGIRNITDADISQENSASVARN